MCLLCMVYFSETEPEFDWAHYLLEGEDLGGGPFPESPVSTSPMLTVDKLGK